MARIVTDWKDKVKEIDKGRKAGMTMVEACKEAGVAPSSYVMWRKRKPARKTYTKKVKANSYQAIPMISENQASDFVLRGQPKQIAQFLKEMTIQFGGQQ